MARSDSQISLRIPTELKGRIKQAADSNHRSVNAEIVHRLEESLKQPPGQKE